MNIADRLTKTHRSIAEACRQNSRQADSVSLIAVSKGHKINKLEEAYQAGQRAFGESYVAEAVEKISQMANRNIIWHFIGPIQSNKTKEIAEHFDWVQSVDRIKIARRLGQQRPQAKGKLNITIQVNLFGEQTKQGCNLEDLPEMVEFVDQQPNLCLRGLMALPPPQADFEQQLKQFKQVAEVFEKVKAGCDHTFDTLSIGMSNDIGAAIAAGSNMVRVGTGIFGERPANWRKH